MRQRLRFQTNRAGLIERPLRTLNVFARFLNASLIEKVCRHFSYYYFMPEFRCHAAIRDTGAAGKQILVAIGRYLTPPLLQSNFAGPRVGLPCLPRLRLHPPPLISITEMRASDLIMISPSHFQIAAARLYSSTAGLCMVSGSLKAAFQDNCRRQQVYMLFGACVLYAAACMLLYATPACNKILHCVSRMTRR